MESDPLEQCPILEDGDAEQRQARTQLEAAFDELGLASSVP